jgi:hypothetical protein
MAKIISLINVWGTDIQKAIGLSDMLVDRQRVVISLTITNNIRKKNNLHIHIPAGFTVPGGGKLWGKNHLSEMTLVRLLESAFPAPFWQTRCDLSVFFT